MTVGLLAETTGYLSELESIFQIQPDELVLLGSEPIASGSYGQVWKAHRGKARSVVAVKILEKTEDPYVISEIMNEYQVNAISSTFFMAAGPSTAAVNKRCLAAVGISSQ